MTRRRGGTRACVAMVIAAATVTVTVAGCSAAAKPSAPTPPPSTTALPTTSMPTTSSAPPPAPAVNPLTGIAPIPSGPVVAVKIDDTANARPMRNIDKADLVYVEQVEGGLTRLLAIYATARPLVSSVRSVRFNDPEILAAFGPVTFVASGGAPQVLNALDQSPLRSDINDRGGPGFQRLGCCAPYNLAADLNRIATVLPGAGVKDVGLTWSAAPATGGRPAASLTTRVGTTAVGFVWDAGLKRWVRVIGGVRQTTAAGDPVSTPNVIVEFAPGAVDPRDVDVAGNPSHYTHTVGSGPVAIFRDGQRIDGTWSRPSAAVGTTYTNGAGQPIALAPGGAWIVLAELGAPLTTG